MSRRAGGRVETLWSSFHMPAPAHPGRSSPPPRDVEDAFGYDGYSNPAQARQHANGEFVAQMQPPRLQSTGALSRIVLMLVCVLCVAVAFCIAGLLLQLPGVDSARGALADVVKPPSALVDTAQPQAAPLPAILKRLRLVKRAKAPEHGADLNSLALAFPQWGSQPSEWALLDVARDVALALAVLSERVPDPTQRAPSPPPQIDEEEDL